MHIISVIICLIEWIIQPEDATPIDSDWTGLYQWVVDRLQQARKPLWAVVMHLYDILWNVAKRIIITAQFSLQFDQLRVYVLCVYVHKWIKSRASGECTSPSSLWRLQEKSSEWEYHQPHKTVCCPPWPTQSPSAKAWDCITAETTLQGPWWNFSHLVSFKRLSCLLQAHVLCWFHF